MYGSSTKEPDTTKSTSPSISIAEEIAKFAELKEQGILTDEEFQAKKKEIYTFLYYLLGIVNIYLKLRL